MLYPVFLQVAVIYALQLWMGRERVRAVQDGAVKRGAHGGMKPVWPERAATVSNAFQNQFEMPVLFFAVAAFSMIANAVDSTMVALAWVFTISRLVHALIYTTYNTVTHRFLVYLAGSMVLLAMWIRLALHATAASA
jgi:hypothetical protein